MHHGEKNRGNVIIHEFAHKLDSINGSANGFPPLHMNMSASQWSKVFTHAYKDPIWLQQKKHPIPINSYAETSPAEFFAVFSEYFLKDQKFYYNITLLFVICLLNSINKNH